VKLATGKYRETHTYFKKVLTLDKQMEKPGLIARDLEKLGDVSEITGQRQEALSYYKRSILIYQQLKGNEDLERLSKKIKAISE